MKKLVVILTAQKIVKVLIIALLLVPLISAVSPFKDINEGGIDILYPPYDVVKQDAGFELRIIALNTTTILTNATTTCVLEILNSTGGETCNTYLDYDDHFTLQIATGNFSDLGVHGWNIVCNTSTQTGAVSGSYFVSEAGLDLSVGDSLIHVGLLFVLVAITIFFILFSKSTESSGVKLFFNLVAYIMMLLTIGAGYIMLESIQTNMETIGDVALYTMAIVFVIIMFYILINLTKQSIDLYREKKGFGSNLDDSATF